MSQWTHVCGCIRYDSVRIAGMPSSPGIPNPTLAALKKMLGNTFSYHDDKEAWDNCTVPFGSEGSIQFSFWEDPDKSPIAAFTVAVFGDLRDFGQEDVKTIKDWFKRVTVGPDIHVRSAILEIDVEHRKRPIILRYKRDWDG